MVEKVLEQGGLFAVLVIGLFSMYKVGWWVAKVLMEPANPEKGEKGGLLVQYFTAHQEFLAGLEKRDAAQYELAKSNTALLSTVQQQVVQAASYHPCADTLHGILRCTLDPLNATIIDIVKARILELSIKPDIPPEEATRLRAQIESIFQEVQRRHQENVRTTREPQGA